MAADQGSLTDRQLARGKHHPANERDLRTPCPMLNCLANHGYLPRNGRDVKVEDFLSALQELNISGPLRYAISKPLYAERRDDDHPRNDNFLSSLWNYVSNPLSILFPSFAVRPPGNVDSNGNPVINLDHLNIHNAVEHDVSLSRRDFKQGDNHRPQKDLIDGLLAASSDGMYLTMEELAKYMKHRIETQQRENKELEFTRVAQQLGAGEIGLILKVLGDGQKIRYDYVKALFSEERLPIEEGWRKRDTPVGILELIAHGQKIKELIRYKA